MGVGIRKWLIIMRRNGRNVFETVTCITLIWAMVSCSGNTSVSLTQTSTPGIAQTSALVATPENKVTESKNITETHAPVTTVNEPVNTNYSFDIFYDNEAHLLSVNEKVVYFNQTNKILEYIPFIVPNDFQISSIVVDGKLFQPIPVRNKNSIMLSFVQKLMKGDSVEIKITYSIVVPEVKGVLGRTDQQVNLADFYPFIPPYRNSEGWLINEPGEVGEYMVYEISDFHLIFGTNISDSYELFTNAHSEKNDDRYFIDAYGYRNVVLSICSECSRSEFDYGTFKVIGSFLSDDKRKGDNAIAIIGQSILYFSELFGVSYPHDEMTIIEADFPDGMEYDGLFFLSKDYFDQYSGDFQNYLSLLSVHETAHQWWYGIIGNDQAKEPWLDEALSTYSEFLFIEELHPDLASWWWDYRVFTYNPDGLVSSTVYDFNNNRPYINAVYLRGALYLRDLRSNLSDDVFFTHLKDYAQRYNGKIADSSGFDSTFISELTPELKKIREKYFGN